MKPSDLCPPYSREERRVVIHDRVWYVPEKTLYPNAFTFPGWNHPDFFGNDNPVHIEYCSGNGAWIAEKAASNPLINWIGVEIQFFRVRKLWSKVKNLGLSNMIVLCGEAYYATKSYIPDDSVQQVYVNFPDPWPKNRHAKHRLMQVEFAEEMWRILRKGQGMTYVTDDPPHSQWLIDIMKKHGKFKSAYSSPEYLTDQNDYGSSFFEQLWRSHGKDIYFHHYNKP